MPTFEYSGLVNRLLALPSESGESSDRLGGTTVEQLFAHPIANLDAAKCCFSGLWLRSGALDRSHEISQSVKTAEGSYWHAIMHRTEGDFWNSKYWLRQVGDHPLFESLAIEVERLDGCDCSSLIRSGRWNPAAFVDYCEAVESGALVVPEKDGEGSADIRTKSLRDKIAGAEWQALFDFCWDLAHER